MEESLIAFAGLAFTALSIGLVIHHRNNKQASLKITFNMSTAINSDGIGTHLAALATVCNPGKDAIFFGGIHALDESKEIYYPSCEIKGGTKLESGQYIQGAIPAAHLINPKARALWVIDGTGKKYPVPKRTLKVLLEQLSAEAERLAALGFK